MFRKYFQEYPATLRDLIIISLGAIAVFLLAGYAEVFERIDAFLVRNNDWQVDELFIVCVFLTFAFAVFSWRRWREVIQSLLQRDQALVETQAATNRAEAANRSKSEFLANMSHEIRTPMNGIIGMTELTLDSPLSEPQRENLRLVQYSAHSLLHILNDILDFSKIEAGKLELDSAPFNIRQVVGDIVKSLGMRAHEKGLELVCHILPDVPERVIGDPLRLSQVLVNLVGNAIKFTGAGEVEVRLQAEAADGNHARFHFSVRDTGIGIAPSQQQLIFEAFTQADSSAKRRFAGTGLGLAISTRLVNLMGGHIWVESEPQKEFARLEHSGVGSTFHFTAEFELDTAPAPNSISVSELAGMRVLVVDDNATNRLILVEMLVGWKMLPASVERGAAAMEALDRAIAAGQLFSLVLLDAMMPDLDGFELAARIQERADLRGVTLMMLSSADSDADTNRCRKLGLAGFLRKPVTTDELRTGILKALANRRTDIPPTETFPAPPLAACPPLNILMAEDNVVNTRVAVAALEKRGHTVVSVLNGIDALRALACERFDLVLMDVQMPEMDGLEATRAIRQQELKTGEHIPIIALTAHAMKGDRERCLQAGMDFYIAKPVEPKVLAEAVSLWAPKSRLLQPRREHLETTIDPQSSGDEEAEAVPVPAAANDIEVFDLAGLKDRVENDLDLLAEMIELHQVTAPKLLAEIESAVTDRQGKDLVRASHALKSVLKSMCASRSAEAALELEMIGASHDLNRADQALLELKAEFEHLQVVLQQSTERMSI